MDKDFLKIAERLFSKRTKRFFLSQAYNKKIAERFLLKGISPTMTDTLPIPGIGRYCVMYHVVVMGCRHLGEIKGNFIFFVNLRAYSPVCSRTDD